jgi:hypothetical protein
VNAAARPVAELLAERAKYTTWLEQLAARTAGAPAHVVAKVRADYEARLLAVREQLAARAGDLEARRLEAVTRRDDARAAEQALADERAEAELRHAVGEYSVEEWEALARDSDAALATAAADRLAAEVSLADLERALAEVEGAALASEPATEAAPEPAPAPEPEPVTMTAKATEAAPEPAAEPALEPALAADLLSVIEPEPAPALTAEVPPVLEPVMAPASEPEPPLPVLAATVESPVQETEPDDAEVPPTVTTAILRPAIPTAPVDDLFLAPILADEPPPPPRVSAPVVPPVAPTVAPPTAPPSGSPAAPPGARIRGTEAFDDLEFIKSLAGGKGGQGGGTTAPGRREPAADDRMADQPANADIGPQSAPSRISREFAPPPEPRMPDPTVSAPEITMHVNRRATDPGVDAIRAMSESPAQSLRQSQSGQATKSLKCAECGAMNYPTEWYCERCGGELASL